MQLNNFKLVDSLDDYIELDQGIDREYKAMNWLYDNESPEEKRMKRMGEAMKNIFAKPADHGRGQITFFAGYRYGVIGNDPNVGKILFSRYQRLDNSMIAGKNSHALMNYLDHTYLGRNIISVFTGLIPEENREIRAVETLLQDQHKEGALRTPANSSYYDSKVSSMATIRRRNSMGLKHHKKNPVKYGKITKEFGVEHVKHLEFVPKHSYRISHESVKTGYPAEDNLGLVLHHIESNRRELEENPDRKVVWDWSEIVYDSEDKTDIGAGLDWDGDPFPGESARVRGIEHGEWTKEQWTEDWEVEKFKPNKMKYAVNTKYHLNKQNRDFPESIYANFETQYKWIDVRRAKPKERPTVKSVGLELENTDGAGVTEESADIYQTLGYSNGDFEVMVFPAPKVTLLGYHRPGVVDYGLSEIVRYDLLRRARNGEKGIDPADIWCYTLNGKRDIHTYCEMDPKTPKGDVMWNKIKFKGNDNKYHYKWYNDYRIPYWKKPANGKRLIPQTTRDANRYHGPDPRHVMPIGGESINLKYIRSHKGINFEGQRIAVKKPASKYKYKPLGERELLQNPCYGLESYKEFKKRFVHEDDIMENGKLNPERLSKFNPKSPTFNPTDTFKLNNVHEEYIEYNPAEGKRRRWVVRADADNLERYSYVRPREKDVDPYSYSGNVSQQRKSFARMAKVGNHEFMFKSQHRTTLHLSKKATIERRIKLVKEQVLPRMKMAKQQQRSTFQRAKIEILTGVTEDVKHK